MALPTMAFYMATSPTIPLYTSTIPLYTSPTIPPSLPRTPTARPALPPTPPMTSTFHQRRTATKPSLPPIAHLDRQLAARAPLTPPEDVFPPPRLAEEPVQEQPFAHPKPDAPYMDWLDVSRSRPAHFIAEKTCEMICYLWFATSAPEHSYPTPSSSPPFSQRPNPATTTLQLVATPTFVQFMQKLLETTQVSQSVIVLSLHYIYRLKDRNRFTPAQPGSEFRIAVAGLMMANKFLDDNTYTNKTWSEVSGIDLAEINRMEKEFLMGVDFNLYVDKSTYESWLNLLKGLVMAKERDSRHFRSKTRSTVRAAKHTLAAHGSAGPSSRTYSRYRSSSYRARSTSPSQTRRAATFSYSRPLEPSSPSPAPNAVHVQPRSGSKRSAEAAFSPTTASYSHLPCKRPMPTSLQLQIPEYTATSGSGSTPHSHSPLEGLQSFATMSLASPHVRQTQSWTQQQRQAPAQTRHVPETLVTPYSMTEERRTAVPQNLYFYTLACSPMDREEEGRARKAKLRYHQPPPPSTTSYSYYHPLPHVNVVQSASTSPHEVHAYPYASHHHHHHHHQHHAAAAAAVPSAPPTHTVHPYSLPHFHDMQWTRPSQYQHQHHHVQPAAYPQQQQVDTESPVPSAPFANAGPPGVQFYPTPVQGASSIYGWGARRR
ncbi:hypothetical protein C0995_001043 [Termitomyces sp. Mi166|nr:hypothetical protein C0995_001043 [Termitomyces sp. Mi166\